MNIKNSIFYSLFIIAVLISFIHGASVLYNYSCPFPKDLLHKKVKITGTISSLPKENKQGVRFELQTGDGLVDLYWSKKLSSSPNFKPGQVWSFTVKLKYPRGFLNPGVFDYGEWLQRHGVKAKGYIVVNKPFRLIKSDSNVFLVNQIRYSISQSLDNYISSQDILSFAQSILLGDKSSMSVSQKTLFQDTGTSHLIAISGLHIGLIFFWFFIIARLFWSLSVRLCSYVSAQIIGMWGGILMAFGYSMLAGFAISTQRALIMLAVFVVARTLKYNISPRRILALSALFVILWWPFSIFDAGFWLSFTAVAFLIYALSARISKNSFFSRWVYPQFLVLVALMPLTIFWFGKISTSAFIANIVAIPIVSFIIVPGLFIALGFTLMHINLFVIIAPVIKLLFIFLTFLQATFDTIDFNNSFNLMALFFAMVGMLLIFSPRGFRLKVLGLVFFLPAIFYNPKLPNSIDFRMYILDVGQGLAVIIQEENYVLVYDTGPKYFSGSDAADMVIVPFLKYIGVKRIDTLVVSHADLDHLGYRGITNIL
ncbi:MAG: competence protein ComEC [Francisellaceae bacterium]